MKLSITAVIYLIYFLIILRESVEIGKNTFKYRRIFKLF